MEIYFWVVILQDKPQKIQMFCAFAQTVKINFELYKDMHLIGFKLSLLMGLYSPASKKLIINWI